MQLPGGNGSTTRQKTPVHRKNTKPTCIFRNHLPSLYR